MTVSKLQEIYSSAKPRQIKSVNDVVDYELLQHGETGDDSITVIPFQVLISIKKMFNVVFHFFVLVKILCECELCRF